MDWAGARERLGAELIGAREAVALRWRRRLAEQGHTPSALEALAPELVLQAGAALADGGLPDWPWTRCGGVLRVDACDGERALRTELGALWDAMGAELSRHTITGGEERAAAEVLARQLDAALRGAAAEVQALLGAGAVDDPALRFGGVRVLAGAAGPSRPWKSKNTTRTGRSGGGDCFLFIGVRARAHDWSLQPQQQAVARTKQG